MNTEWTALLLCVQDEGSGGGHIFSESKGATLCGIEKRFPQIEWENDHGEEEFLPWLKLNRPWLCGNCLRSYDKHPKRIASQPHADVAP